MYTKAKLQNSFVSTFLIMLIKASQMSGRQFAIFFIRSMLKNDSLKCGTLLK